MSTSLRNQTLGFRRSHAFVIGINEYPNLNANLKTAVKDSVEIAKRLKALQGFDHVLLMNNVGKDQIEALLTWLCDKDRPANLQISDRQFPDTNPPYASQVAWLKWAEELTATEKVQDLKEVTLDWESEHKGRQKERLYLTPGAKLDIQPEDSIVFYYAGHGFPGEFKSGPAGYLALTDAINKQTDNESLLPMNEVYQALSEAKCKHTLLILDCCFAGKFRFSSLSRAGSRPFVQPLYKRRYERYKSSEAWQVLVSAGPDQRANDSAKWARIRDHSPFAKTLIDALEGKADAKTMSNRTQGDGIITAHELFLYIWDQVEEITAKQKVQHPGLFPMKQHREGEFIFINPNVEADQFKFAKDPDRNPYKGLVSYEPEDADLFFGRDRALARLQRILPLQEMGREQGTLKKQCTPFVLFITAPSAAGKSSLVQAGLFPALHKRYGYDELLLFRPAAEIHGQSIVPNEEKHKGEYRREKWKGFKELHARLRDQNKKQLVLVDQFEEYFTEFVSENDQIDFAVQLSQLIGKEDDRREQPLLVVFTVRSDVEWRMTEMLLAENRENEFFKYWTPQHIFRLQSMDLDELRQALAGPAWWAMHDFKDTLDGDYRDKGEELINQILKDVMYYPAALPLLSCVMENLYEKAKAENRNQKLLKEDYNSFNGVEGALSAHAEKLYLQLDKKQQALMQKTLLRMVNLGAVGYTRRKVSYSESAKSMEVIGGSSYELDYTQDVGGQQLKMLIDTMEAANLLVQGKNQEGQPTVEPAHDALIDYWPRCLKWIDDFGKDNLMLQRQLWTAIEESIRQTKKESEQEERGKASTPHPFFDPDHLWDTNRKLEQLFDRLVAVNLFDQPSESTTSLLADIEQMQQGLEERDRTYFQQFIEDCKTKDRRPNFDALIITGSSAQLLNILLEKGDHWFNQTEEAFIRQSWEKRTLAIMRLKQERDEAIALSLAAKSRRLLRENPIIGLNLAMAAYRLAPLEETRLALKEDYLANDRVRFYEKTMIGHTSEIISVTFSPDGQFILTGSKDNTAILWNLEGEKIQTFEGHSAGITSVAFSPDGQFILTGSLDTTAILWNLQGEQMRVFEGHITAVNSVAFSPGGQFILTGSLDTTAILWNLQGEQVQILEYHIASVNSVAFSPDGQFILTGSSDRTAILWGLRGGQIQLFQSHMAPVNSVTFSPDGQFILTGSFDTTAILWNLQGEQVQVLEDHIASVNSVAFSLDGQSILTGSLDERAILWDLQGGQVQAFHSHTAEVSSVAFSPDGQSILIGSWDERAILSNLQGEHLQVFEGHTAAVSSVAFSSDGQSILTGSLDEKAILWDLQGGQLQVFEGHITGVNSVAFSPDGQLVLTSSSDGSAILWNLQGEQIQVFKDHLFAVTSVSFSPDGKTILTGSWDKTAILWNLQGEQLQVFKGHLSAVRSVAFSPDGKMILTGSRDKTAIMWDIQGKQIQIFEGHLFAVRSAIFSPRGQFIMTGAEDNTAILWNLQGEQLQVFEGHSSYVLSVSFSPDGHSVLTGSRDKTSRIWRNFHGEWAAGSIWDRLYKLNEEERKAYKIDWAY